VIKKTNKNSMRWIFMVLGIALLVIGVAGVSYAAFSDKGEVQGTSVSVGSADIKLFDDVGGVIEETNLVDSKTGPSFENITQIWTDDYLVKLFNNANGQVNLFTNSDYETVNDPDDLRNDLYVEPIEWLDSDNDGFVSEGEEGQSYGKKSIVKWKTEGFDLGPMDSGNVRAFIMRFSTDENGLSDSKQGTEITFDFVFDAMGLE